MVFLCRCWNRNAERLDAASLFLWDGFQGFFLGSRLRGSLGPESVPLRARGDTIGPVSAGDGPAGSSCGPDAGSGAGFLSLIGSAASLGRGFMADEEQTVGPSGPRVVAIGGTACRLWGDSASQSVRANERIDVIDRRGARPATTFLWDADLARHLGSRWGGKVGPRAAMGCRARGDERYSL